MVTGLLLEVFAYAWLVGTISNATHGEGILKILKLLND